MNEREFEFTLKIALPNGSDDPERYVDYLAEAGCTDALVGIGKKGRLALEFSRSAFTARDAIVSALEDVFRAIPHVRLIEAGPDLVGIAEAADYAGFSRQNMRELMLSDVTTAPVPIHDGSSGLFHLAKVLTWLRDRKNRPIDEDLLEVATSVMQLNILKEMSELPDKKPDAKMMAVLAPA